MIQVPARRPAAPTAAARLALRIALVLAASLRPAFGAAPSPPPAAADTVAVSIDASRPGAKIDRNIFGQFAEHLGTGIYEGVWVGPDSPIPNTRGIRNDVVAALKNINIPVLRWPGGCFADEYHWRDGIGPREQRPARINSFWGMVIEDNSFGTHEFLELCSLLETEPYIAGNVGSGTPQEMANWIEYLNFDGESALAKLRKQNGHEKPYK